jgi:hypothetical protein
MIQYPLFLAQKGQFKFSLIYCIKKLVELVEYSTKKSKISHYLTKKIRVSLIEPYS